MSIEWFKQQPVDEDGKIELPQSYSGETPKDPDAPQESWKDWLLRAILQKNLQDLREDCWD